jgi:2-dehydropantoate 2-reductase
MMTIQNGLGAEELVRGHGDWPLLSAVTFMSGVRHGDTHVEYELDTETWLGPFAGTATYEQAQEVEALLINAGLRARAFPDLRPAQWSKLIFNATVNTVAALTDLPHVSAFAARNHEADLGHLVHDLMDEGKAVAAAAGVALHDDPWEMNVEAVRRGETLAAEGQYAHVPSMLEDVRAGRPTEIDFITGALLREGEKHGVPVPLHTAMYRLVKAREGERERE